MSVPGLGSTDPMPMWLRITYAAAVFMPLGCCQLTALVFSALCACCIQVRTIGVVMYSIPGPTIALLRVWWPTQATTEYCVDQLAIKPSKPSFVVPVLTANC